MSRMLPGRPLWPYGIFSGSTSMVLPLGRNVTLYFFVAGLYLTSSIYGLLPPMIYPLPILAALTSRQARAQRCCAPTNKPSDFGELAAFQGRRDCGVHQQFREMLGRVIQFINALANEFVVAAGRGFLQHGNAGGDF